jgi:hypothetical protein
LLMPLEPGVHRTARLPSVGLAALSGDSGNVLVRQTHRLDVVGPSLCWFCLIWAQQRAGRRLSAYYPVCWYSGDSRGYSIQIYSTYSVYNPQLQPTIFSLFSLTLSPHVSVPTDHHQVNHINIFVFMRRITILHRHIHFTLMLLSQLFI